MKPRKNRYFTTIYADYLALVTGGDVYVRTKKDLRFPRKSFFSGGGGNRTRVP